MPFEAEPIRDPAPRPSRARVLSGRGVLLSLGLFFGAMLVANGALIYSALHTLPGGELGNAYDESQTYNQSIAQSQAQTERGWQAQVSAQSQGPDARVVFSLRDRDGARIDGLQVRARFENPSDRRADKAISLEPHGDTYEGVAQDVHAGQWTLMLEAATATEKVYVTRNRVVLAATPKNTK
jgi:nitrogen fixation protein FixH